jgi:hypothetical protein
MLDRQCERGLHRRRHGISRKGEKPGMTRSPQIGFVVAIMLGMVMSYSTSAQERATPTPPVTTDIFEPTVAEATPISGVQTFVVESRAHTDQPVDYPQDPPVGGPHAPVWQKCQFYDEPVQKERAVHSLEHGAVWITYRPDLPEADRKILKKLTKDQPYLLVSPYPGLKDLLVASAWGVQLRLDRVDDPRLALFIARYAGNGPERGASCASGVETTVSGS